MWGDYIEDLGDEWVAVVESELVADHVIERDVVEEIDFDFDFRVGFETVGVVVFVLFDVLPAFEAASADVSPGH